MNMQRVDVRVEPELLDELDELSERLNLGSRSAVIREAIVQFILESQNSWNSAALRVEIPNRIAERMQRQIMNGDATDPQQAVVLALDFWLRDMEDYYIRRRPRMDKLVRANIESDSAMKELEQKGRDLGRP